MTVATKSRPIIMSADSVRAILDGRKTQTRRVITFRECGKTYCWNDEYPLRSWNFDTNTGVLYVGCSDFACPYGVPGDLLWVRERWRYISLNHHMESGRFVSVQYDALGENGYSTADYRPDWRELIAGKSIDWLDLDSIGCAPSRWRSPMYMPRWASRLLLRVVKVSVERVQEISKYDVLAEGAVYCVYGAEQEIFQDLWDSLNAKRGFSWGSNPYVWVIQFERAEEPA